MAAVGLLPLGIHYVCLNVAWNRREVCRRCLTGGDTVRVVSQHAGRCTIATLAHRGGCERMGVIQHKYAMACLTCEAAGTGDGGRRRGGRRVALYGAVYGAWSPRAPQPCRGGHRRLLP